MNPKLEELGQDIDVLKNNKMLEEQNSFEQRDIVKLSQNSLREPKSNNLKIKFQDIILEKQPSQDSVEDINNSQSSKGHE